MQIRQSVGSDINVCGEEICRNKNFTSWVHAKYFSRSVYEYFALAVGCSGLKLRFCAITKINNASVHLGNGK